MSSLFYALDLRSETGKIFHEQRVAPVDMKDIVHLGVTVGHQPGKHQSGAGPDVRRPHRSTRELRKTSYDGMVPVGAGVGTEANHLLDKPEPRLEHVLGNHRCAIGDRRQTNRHRRQTRGEPRTRNRPPNTFSVIIEWPSAIDARPIAIGCRSVGNPGYGNVETLTAFGRSYWVTRKLSSVCVTVAPTSCSLCSTT